MVQEVDLVEDIPRLIRNLLKKSSTMLSEEDLLSILRDSGRNSTSLTLLMEAYRCARTMCFENVLLRTPPRVREKASWAWYDL